jgi:hypothetical protein
MGAKLLKNRVGQSNAYYINAFYGLFIDFMVMNKANFLNMVVKSANEYHEKREDPSMMKDSLFT